MTRWRRIRYWFSDFPLRRRAKAPACLDGPFAGEPLTRGIPRVYFEFRRFERDSAMSFPRIVDSFYDPYGREFEVARKIIAGRPSAPYPSKEEQK